VIVLHQLEDTVVALGHLVDAGASTEPLLHHQGLDLVDELGVLQIADVGIEDAQLVGPEVALVFRLEFFDLGPALGERIAEAVELFLHLVGRDPAWPFGILVALQMDVAKGHSFCHRLALVDGHRVRVLLVGRFELVDAAAVGADQVLAGQNTNHSLRIIRIHNRKFTNVLEDKALEGVVQVVVGRHSQDLFGSDLLGKDQVRQLVRNQMNTE
jgi:hypothetical protein